MSKNYEFIEVTPLLRTERGIFVFDRRDRKVRFVDERNQSENDWTRVEDVIFNGPAVIAKFSDGSKTVAKCKDGDTYDPLFGLMACIVRKLTRNRGHAVDDFEPKLKAIAAEIEEPSDVRYMVERYRTIYQMMRMLEESSDVWIEHLGDREKPTFEDVIEELTESVILDQDAMRQTIRDLLDKGEL